MEVENLAAEAEDFTGNVWLVKSEDGNALVDAGAGDAWKEVSELEDVEEVVLTHSHHDHVENLEKVVEKFSPEVYAFEPENLDVEASELADGGSVEIAGAEFDVIHTPGHTDDSVCLYSPEEGVLFAGDLVFPDGGFGRTDLEEGDREALIRSIRRVDGLRPEQMYCGHGEPVEENASSQVEESLRNAERREPKY